MSVTEDQQIGDREQTHVMSLHFYLVLPVEDVWIAHTLGNNPEQTGKDNLHVATLECATVPRKHHSPHVPVLPCSAILDHGEIKRVGQELEVYVLIGFLFSKT